MNSLPSLVPWATGILLSLVVLGAAVRAARTAYLQRVTLTDERLRELQVDITERARTASLTPGQEIDLRPYWRQSRLREPDRRAVVHSLIASHVFGWYERTGGDATEALLTRIGRAVWMPTRTHVIVSQWIVGTDTSTRVVIEKVLGTVVVGDVDASTTYGPRAGGDVIGGDSVGGDKAGGNMTKAASGGSATSAVGGDAVVWAPVTITTPLELSDALSRLADRAAAHSPAPETIEAIRWAAAMATSTEEPPALEHSRHQRVLDRAAPWIREGIAHIVRGVSGAVASHWLVEFLRG